MNLKVLWRSFGPGFDPLTLAEKSRSALAAGFAIFVLGEALHFLPDGGHPLLLFASMAAAAVLLYAFPHSPMAQPWPLLVGNLLSGLMGWLCSLYIPDPVWAASCAVGLAIFVMHLTHSLHPPGAATAMIMVLHASDIQHHGWLWVGGAVLANALFSLLLALIINNLIHAGRYPVLHHAVPPQPAASAELAEEDIEWALQKMEGVIDVNEEDLLEIYRLANEHVRLRQNKGSGKTALESGSP
jgi:CBS domain-containing membrane protein